MTKITDALGFLEEFKEGSKTAFIRTSPRKPEQQGSVDNNTDNMPQVVALDMSAILSELRTTNAANPLPSAPIPTGEVDLTPQAVEDYRKKLQAAYPDQKIDLKFDPVTGAISGTVPGPSIAQSRTLANPQMAEQQRMQGIDLMRQRLELATTNEEKLNAAYTLKQMAADQAVFNFNKFRGQAETKFGIPDLELAIEQIKAAERMDPNNPGLGMPSDQRLALLSKLGEARVAARGYINELVVGDTAVKTAENLADSVLAKFSKTDDLFKLTIMEQKRAQDEAKKAELLADPRRLNRMAVLTGGKLIQDDASRNNLAESWATGKVKLDAFDEGLLMADTSQLQAELLSGKGTIPQRQKMKAILLTDELAVTKNEQQAKENMRLFDAVMNSNIDGVGETAVGLKSVGDIPNVLSQYKQQLSEQEKQWRVQGLSAKEMKDRKDALAVGVKRQLLQTLANAKFNENVASWNGVMRSDATALAVLKANGDKLMDGPSFIAAYTNYNDGRPLAAKIDSMRSIIDSAATAAATGSILGDPKPASLLMAADRMMLDAVTRPFANIHGTSSWADFADRYKQATLNIVK